MSTETKNHIGRKISRIRELRGMKQEALAAALGVSQQSVSNLEKSEILDFDQLEKVAKALGVTTDAIERFNEEAVFNYFNNFHDHSGFYNYSTFNPLDKLVEAYDENKKLYERLLQAEKDKIVYLEKLAKDK
jgi:transcriptional regulator with XRE-family HTH domain